MKKLLAKIRKILHDRRTRRFLTRFVSGVAALIVFVTTYALVLPAITMEKEANCGIEAHQHDDFCYTEELICDIPESDGHHHDESCYSTTSALVCETEEHEHSAENGCYDDEGNLICEVMEHRHNEECYEEVRELTCQIPESEGHHHTEDCYEKVLTCGKEVHVHSTACYENDPVSESAIAASTSSAAASTTSVGSVSSAGMTLNFEGDIEKIIDADEPVDGDPVDNLGSDKTNGSSETNDTSEIASSSETNTEAASDTEVTYGRENAGTGRTETSNTALTNADNNATALTSSADTDQYIPQLDAVDFNTVLNNHTGIYYYRAADEDIVEDSSAIPAEDWNRIPNNIDRINDDMDDVELGNKDLLRVYLSYTIPAGSLNATNPVARYRLPSNLHLTDPQVKAINENVNGLAGQYVDMSTLEITDPDKYNAYLGVEAVEGTRRPDEAVEDYLAEQAWKAGKDAENATEYISAVVRVENVYDADGLYGEKDAYLGQDLIFTFAPYSIEKNQHEYDSTGKPTKAGEEIKGWFTFDLNMGQVDFEEPEITTSTVKESDTENAKGDNKDNQIGKDDPEDIKPDAGFGEDDNHQNEHSEDSHSVDNSAADHESVMDAESGKEAENASKSLVTIKRSERSAEIVFIEDDWYEKGNKINQISTTLTAVEKIMVEAQDDDTEENNTETAREDESTAITDNTTEKINNDETEKTASDDKEDTVDVSSGKKTLVDSEESDQIIMPAMSFTDSIKVSTGKPSGIDENAGGILADAAESLPEKAKVLVRVEADEGTFPAGTKMVLKAVTKEDMEALAETVANTVEKDSSDSVENSVPNTNTGDNKKNNVNRQNNNSNSSSNIKAFGFQAVDITFFDKDGNEIEPAKPVRVALTSKTVEQFRKEAENSPIADPVVVHVDNDGNAEQMELVVPEDVEPAKGKTEEELNETIAAEETSTAGDDADTADDSDVDTVKQSEKNENKEPQESSEDSSTETSVGDNISSAEDEMGAVEKGTDTEEQLNPDNDETESKGVTAGTGSTVEFEAESFSVYAIVYTVDFHWEVDGKTYDFSLPGGGFVSFAELVEVLGIADQDATPAEPQGIFTSNLGDEESDQIIGEELTLGDVAISDNTRKFVENVESIAFSTPSLLSVSKVNESETVGQIKNDLGLEVQYSAELTEEQIADINDEVVESGDWALISMQPFVTQEELTVTMTTGEVFAILVTDYQISTNVLTADGKTYKITVTFGDDAEIPAGTKLIATEIEPGTDDYIQHLGKAWSEVNRDYLEQEEKINSNQGGLDEYEDIRPVNLDEARFFDIKLLFGENEIEPKAPVHVQIDYIDGLDTNVTEEEQVIGVAHYKEDVTELITDVETERDDEGKITEFTYDQDSFSGVGTFVGQKTYDNAPYEMNRTLAMPMFRALSRTTREGNTLKDIEAHKSLNNNHDGTYTMSLTVKGDSVVNEEYTKANILFVMDRSSSMTKSKNDIYTLYDGEYQTNTTYYGKSGDSYFALAYSNGKYYRLDYWGNPDYLRQYTGDRYTRQSRLKAEQAAMDVLIQNLIGKNDPNTPGKEDLIEISVISFAEARCSGNTEYLDWTTSDYTGLMNAVNQTDTPEGTNWEDALVYAKEQADAKKRAQQNEDVYVIFLTDGEPTAVYGEHNGAVHYKDDWGNTIRGGFDYALTESGTYEGPGKENDGKNSLDRAKEIVDSGYKFYGIFTFNPGEAQTKYLRRLMNFAYTGQDVAYANESTKEDTDIVKKYFTNADTPEALTEAFEKIFADISNFLGHGDVVITDGLQSADAMTTTIHADKADGFRYSVTDDETGEELYYVTATGNDTNPTVTFHIDGDEYPAGESKTGFGDMPYYSVNVNGAEYKMALADLTGRELTWNLTALGALLPGCTYKADVIVWPNQAAYDYVAGLNNKLPGYTWDASVESNPANYHEVTVDGTTYGYYTGGVAGHDSIVKYADSDVYSVLTNTHQELNYSIVNTKTNEVTGETTMTSNPQEPIPLEPQKPMDLVDTSSKIEKQWNVELDPSILQQLLYPADGTHYNLDFDVYQDKVANSNLYKTITLGWDTTKEDYVWQKNFAIPTGLMLSEERMDALGMDKSAYPSGTYPVDPDDPNSEVETYYVLEPGHDYIIKERGLSFEFDFNADVFHPMLVDGKMQNVNFTTSGNSISISNMTKTVGGLSSLKVENTLRGYIHLEKHVVDMNDEPINTDKTRFEYSIVLTNEEGVFEGTHIPWYGVNNLYYHDRSFNYYQVYYDNNVLKLKDESGTVYPVIGTYDLTDASEQRLTYKDGEEEKVLMLSGNQTTPSNNKTVASAVLQMCQGELLSIANVPEGTRYSVVETDKAGYELVGIDKWFAPEDVEEDPDATTINLDEGSILGTIVPYHHNYISYTNKCLVTDISIQKVDEKGKGLEGAVFQLKQVNGSEEIEASTIASVSGLGKVTKEVDGKTVEYTSAFETTGGVQTIHGLPDGTYRLYEVYVPAGYITTYRYIQFAVVNRAITNVTTDTGDTSKLVTNQDNIDIKISNEPGAALPNTGGHGTRIYMILGSILILGAGVLLWRRRRMI